MEDDDLAQIRKARLEQLKAQADAGGGAGQPNSDNQQAENETRQAMLAQILEPAAADRLGRIRLVKESRAHDVENRLFALARSGQLRSKITETQLKDLLGAVAETRETERIVVSRRKAGWDDDDDELAGLM
ncbi:hypothetical protein K3495_g1187 [Podosphaera aphanis]|nr:hypothetical protein K3495_g1187 [Podosphaera aphanis]